MPRFQISSAVYLILLLTTRFALAAEPSPVLSTPSPTPSPSALTASPTPTPTPTPTASHHSDSNSTASVDHVDKQTIFFTGSPSIKPLKTELFDLVFISPLIPEDGTVPYFLFAANPCADCSQERALYLIRPMQTPQITSFVYPGHVLDGKSHQLILDSRGFYGHCTATSDHSDQYIVFQRENVDRRHRGLNSVFIAEASDEYLRERLIERGMPKLQKVLQQVKLKRCHEIAGRSRTMPIKPRGLSWRNLKQQQGDEDDESDAESNDSEDGDVPGASGPTE